jgi:hypothetical protein
MAIFRCVPVLQEKRVGLGHYPSGGHAFLAVVAIVVGRSLRVPHASTRNRTVARNSLKRKHMIRIHLAETLITALGAGGRRFKSCRPDQWSQRDTANFQAPVNPTVDKIEDAEFSATFNMVIAPGLFGSFAVRPKYRSLASDDISKHFKLLCQLMEFHHATVQSSKELNVHRLEREFGFVRLEVILKPVDGNRIPIHHFKKVIPGDVAAVRMQWR